MESGRNRSSLCHRAKGNRNVWQQASDGLGLGGRISKCVKSRIFYWNERTQTATAAIRFDLRVTHCELRDSIDMPFVRFTQNTFLVLFLNAFRVSVERVRMSESSM